MSDKPGSLNVVVLTEDVPDGGLLRGQRGTIVEMLDDDHALLEVAGKNGRANAIVQVPITSLRRIPPPRALCVGVLPKWACLECGTKRAGPVRGDVTWHQGQCGICDRETSVTEFQNYRK